MFLVVMVLKLEHEELKRESTYVSRRYTGLKKPVVTCRLYGHAKHDEI